MNLGMDASRSRSRRYGIVCPQAWHAQQEGGGGRRRLPEECLLSKEATLALAETDIGAVWTAAARDSLVVPWVGKRTHGQGPRPAVRLRRTRLAT